MRKLLVVGVLGAVAVGLLVSQQYSRTNPERRAGKIGCGRDVLDCKCAKVVDDIQQFEREKCLPGDKECFKNAYLRSAHCEVMTNHWRDEWARFIRDMRGTLNLCANQCAPSRCFCGDQPCPGHHGRIEPEE